MSCLSDVEIAKVAAIEHRLPSRLTAALRSMGTSLADLFIQDAISRGHRPDVERIKRWAADDIAHDTPAFTAVVVGTTAKSEEELRARRARKAEAEAERERSMRRPLVVYEPEKGC